jgi:superfamily II DNA or RNA helicase
LDSDPLRRGKQFEKITKWWLQNDPIHSRDVKKVWLWDDWPDRPGRDIGVDLVAEMRDGSLCAIQSKCFDMGRDIPKSELDSFVSAASTRTFKHRWLVASTDGLSANARRMLRDNHVTQILFSYLDSLEGFWPASFDALGGTPTIVKASPRPHQQDAIRDVVEGLSKVSRGQLIMACGTGKTLTALWITEALEPSTTLVLVPSLSLLSQTLSEWAKNANSKWDYLCVCSDETVNKSDDAPISTTDELPFDVTTKSADIAAFFERRGRKIVFSTYQSSAQVAKAQKTTGKKFDLVICDEAHRLTGKNDAEFATALDDTKIPAKKRLFMTATPRTYTASVKAKASERGVEITSMDDEKMFGKELHKLSFGQAIEKNLLTDYRVVIVGVTDPQVQELIDQRELVSIAGTIETDARTLAAHIGLAKATKDYDLKRTISFHGRIKTAQQFAQQHAAIVEWMPEDHKPIGSIWADTITGAMNSSDRRKLLNKLKADVPGQHALLSNARCLTEGIDVPSLDGVAFIDPRSSQVDIIQAVGRAIRKSNNKLIGTIILPLLLQQGLDFDESSVNADFKSIWQVVNALKSHDNQLEKELSQMRFAMGKGSMPIVPPRKIIISLPASIDLLSPNFTEALNLKIVEMTTSSWDYSYGQLCAFAEENGHSSPKKRDENGATTSLGSWTVDQRIQYKKGHLPPERAAKLSELPNWQWDLKGEEISIETKVEALEDYIREFGNLPTIKNRTKIAVNGKPLTDYVTAIRSLKRQGQLSPTIIARVESLPGWDWTPANQSSWEQAFEVLQRFVSRENHANVPQSHIEDGFALGVWVANQRKSRRDAIKFSPERRRTDPRRIELLESLPGWAWDRNEAAFNSIVNALRNFHDREGHYRVPHGHVEHGLNLGRAIRNLRRDYKVNRHRLSPDDIETVELLPNWSWTPLEDVWGKSVAAVKQFAKEYGHLSPDKNLRINGINIANFLHATRRSRRKGQLSLQKQLEIESIPGFDWNGNIEVSLDVHIAALMKYLEVHGDLMVPYRYRTETGLKLGIWVSSQRTRKRQDLISDSYVSKLEAIPEWSWD